MTPTTERPGVGPVTSFPRQQARTRRFSLGVPRNFTVSPDGQRVVFLRSPAGDDPGTSLWVYDVTTGSEREVASARQTLGGGEENLPDEERARRERSRELAGGITAYACDDAVRYAAFALSGRLWWVALEPGDDATGPVELPAPSGVVDPRPDPTGENVAFLSGPCLHVVPTHRRPAPLHAGRRGGTRRSRCHHLGCRRVHCRRGDGQVTWVLVVPGRPVVIGRSSRQRPGRDLVDG